MRRTVALISVPALLAALLIFVPATLAGGGCHDGGAKASAGTGTTVKIDGCTFMPSITRVPAGTVVTWLNSSVTPHDVTGAQSAWGSRLLNAGDSFSQTFASAGLYPYSCSLHPGMAGMVDVVADGSVALTGDSTPDESAADLSGSTGATPAETGDLTPVVSAGLGIVVGAIGALFFLRRRGSSGAVSAS